MLDFPANPVVGQTWGPWTWDGTEWNSGAAGGTASFPEAPADGQTYGRNGATTSWLPVLPLTGGVVSGPLQTTATGGTVARAEQDRAADVANVLDFGADPTGGADSTSAAVAAFATGRNVYFPAGSYIIRNQLTTTANGQEIYGAGRGLTSLLIDQTFSSTATCVISLTGREQLSPTVRDLSITFAQPSDQTSRANFKTLAAGGTSGTGGTGVMYPPAIGITSANRFKLRNLKISKAWDGVVNISLNTVGGFFIHDVEISAFDCGLWIDNCLDYAHISHWHHWPFDLSLSLQQVFKDGATYSAKFGVNGSAQGLNVVDFTAQFSRVLLTNSQSTMQLTNFMGDTSFLEITGCAWCLIANAAIAGAPGGANPNPAQITMSGGDVQITNARLQGNGMPVINCSGGFLRVTRGWMSQNAPAVSAVVVQSGGQATFRSVAFTANTGAGAWTVPMINVQSGGYIIFQDNNFEAASVGDVGALVIATDSARHSVSGNYWNGWHWTPPGNLGYYAFNTDLVAPKTVTMQAGAVVTGGNLTVGSATGTGQSFFLQSAAGNQRTLSVYTATTLRWAMIFDGSAESGGNAGCNFSMLRFGDTGSLLGTPFAINRATGLVSIGPGGLGLPSIGNYANDAAAAAGGVAVGSVYRNGSALQVRVT